MDILIQQKLRDIENFKQAIEEVKVRLEIGRKRVNNLQRRFDNYFDRG